MIDKIEEGNCCKKCEHQAKVVDDDGFYQIIPDCKNIHCECHIVKAEKKELKNWQIQVIKILLEEKIEGGKDMGEIVTIDGLKKVLRDITKL